ncbi:MAG: cytochrome c [Gammaproteobacteria bacterium]
MNHHENGSSIKVLLGLRLLVGLLLCAVQLPVLADAPDEQKLEAMMQQGKEIYGKTCVACHQSDGMGIPGNFPPLVDGAPFEASLAITDPLEKLGLWKDGVMTLGEDRLKYITYVVVNGMPGTRMFAFGPTLSNEEIAAVVTYMRNAWGNNMGDMATPELVERMRRR